MSNDLLLGIVLDESGSMGYLKNSTTEGINTLVEQQMKEEGETYLTLTVFNTRIDARYVAMNAKEISPLGSPGNRYHPSGGTALYDAVAVTIKGIELWLKNNDWFTGEVMLAIWTDGQENSSVEYSRFNNGLKRLNDLIAAKQNKGWNIVFLGAGDSAWTEGEGFTAIAPEHRVYIDASPKSYAANTNAVSASASLLRSTGTFSSEAYSRSASVGGNAS